LTKPSCRAAAILKAKSGQEQALVDFTLEVMPEIRKVDGLRNVEVSRSVSDPGRLLIYYWWDSPAHSERYVAGPA
jgi:quinol monooxygenase YgiN